MKLYVVVITQTLRPNSLPILTTDKPETRHLLTDKVHSQMGKFTLVRALGASFFYPITGLIRDSPKINKRKETASRCTSKRTARN